MKRVEFYYKNRDYRVQNFVTYRLEEALDVLKEGKYNFRLRDEKNDSKLFIADLPEARKMIEDFFGEMEEL